MISNSLTLARFARVKATAVTGPLKSALATGDEVSDGNSDIDDEIGDGVIEGYSLSSKRGLVGVPLTGITGTK